MSSNSHTDAGTTPSDTICTSSMTTSSPKNEKKSKKIRSKESKILVLVNRYSGRGVSMKIYNDTLIPFLEVHNIDHQVFITEPNHYVSDYLSTKELKDYKSIVVLSGDGLLFETVNALMQRSDWKQARQIPIGIVPTGSGNGLAFTLLGSQNALSKDRASLLDDTLQYFCKQAIQDDTCQADLIKITYGHDTKTTLWSFLSTGWGLMADIDIDSEWLRCVGELRFTIYGLMRSLMFRSRRGKLSYRKMQSMKGYKTSDSYHKRNKIADQPILNDDRHNNQIDINTRKDNKKPTQNNNYNNEDWICIEDRFACIYAVYQAYISRQTNMAPKSTLADQTIYLTFIRGRMTPCQAIQFFLAIEDGSHENLDFVTVVPTQHFILEPLEESKIVVDGEKIDWCLGMGPIEAQIESSLLNLAWSTSLPFSNN